MKVDPPENLFAAIAQCNVIGVENLLAEGADPREVDVHRYESTPLEDACSHGDEAAVRVLLDAKADLNAAAFEPPLVAATEHGFANLVSLLVKAGADVNAADESGASALWMAAVKERRTQVINAATGQSASPAAEPEWPFSGGIAKGPWVTQDFPSVAASRNVEWVRRMLDAGLAPDWTQFSPIVRSLLAAGADPNAPDNEGQRPLQRALTHAIPVLVQVLLDAGADPAGRMPADWAPSEGKHAGAIRDVLEAARK